MIFSEEYVIFIRNDVFTENGENILIGKAPGRLFHGASRFFYIIRCGFKVIQICEAEDIEILKVVISKDHVHMHIDYRPSHNLTDLVKKLKGRSSRKFQEEFPELKMKYWGALFWAIGYECWSTGNITDEMVNE